MWEQLPPAPQALVFTIVTTVDIILDAQLVRNSGQSIADGTSHVAIITAPCVIRSMERERGVAIILCALLPCRLL